MELSDGYLARFSGVARLYGKDALSRLAGAHVTVIGVGGVGSWTVEALARSGIGVLTLIDMDDVCVTNTNRQLPALDGTIGHPKIDVLGNRVREINPECRVECVPMFVTPGNVDSLVPHDTHFVVEAVDRTSIKAAILHECRTRRTPVVTVGGSGGRRDPTRLQVADLAVSGHDMLLRLTRKRLRRVHQWEMGNGQYFGIRTVFSTEPQVFPWGDGSVCAEPEPDSPLRMDCASGVGAAAFLTGTVGFLAASEVVTQIATSQIVRPTPLTASPAAEPAQTNA